jgi:hypothetical protein
MAKYFVEVEVITKNGAAIKVSVPGVTAENEYMAGKKAEALTKAKPQFRDASNVTAVRIESR